MPLSSLIPLLPTPLSEEIHRLHLSIPPAELRLRCGRAASLSVYRSGGLVNLPLAFCADEEDMRRTLSRATGGSLYSYEEEIKEGFFTLPSGVRVGVAGRVNAVGDVLTLTQVGSIVFRLPVYTERADALYSFFTQTTGGILLFSPPGGGKTTLLRAFAIAAAKTQRVAVIDTRREFFFPSPHLLLDHLSGYPKAKGAEIALRTLSPEIILFDEIGVTEAAELCQLVSFGVRTIASVHASSSEALLSAPALSPLLRAGLFSHLWDVAAGKGISFSQEDVR